MNNLYNKIYEAVSTGIQKALIISDDQSYDTSIRFHNKEITSDFIPYDQRLVNLGLHSGLLWCEYNIGAMPGNLPSDWYGDYYTWGETEINSDYSWKTYKHYDELSDTLTKYAIDDETVTLENIDDAASNILGRQYRMPTKDEIQELLDNTTQEWLIDYKGIHGLDGALYISNINGNAIFFPAAGYYKDMKFGHDNVCGSIWSSTLNAEDWKTSFYMFVYPHALYPIASCIRCCGLNIRGVCENNKSV